MSDSTSDAVSSGGSRPQNSLGRILAVVLPIALLGLAAFWWSKTLEARARGDAGPSLVGRMFTAESAPAGGMTLADKDNDLVADPPEDAAKLITPETLVFSYVAAAEGEGPGDDTWKELAAAIQAKTGKKVKVAHYTTADEQMAALKNGALHITGVNTGLVQSAVEQDGFVPLCTFGHDDGTWGYTMEFLVPAGSPIKKLSDIKGHKLTFARLDSNSGCKAPLVLLKEKYELLPGRDYEYGFSQGHKDSIRGVAAKEFEVAPVASDIYAGMIEKKEIDPAAVVSIYKSERFPPATFGYVYNLAPELRDGIRETILKFDWKGTGVAKEFGPGGATKFVPVNYKDDWANTRRIDQVIAEARKASAASKSGS